MKISQLATGFIAIFLCCSVTAQDRRIQGTAPPPSPSASALPLSLTPAVTEPAGSTSKVQAPRWQMARVYEIDSGESISLRWTAVPGADGYEVKIKNRARDYEPSSHFIEKNFTRAKLNPGQFELRIVTVSGGKVSDESAVQITIKRKRPLQIDRVDFMARFSYTKFEYDMYTYETGTGIPDSFYDGGALAFRANFWILDSKWGARIAGLWGGFNYFDQSIAYNDFSLGAVYRIENKDAIFAPYFGFRVWTMPIVRLLTPALSQTSFRIFTPSLGGVAAGADVTLPLGGAWSFEGNAEMSMPLVDSTIGDDFLAQKNPLPIVGGKISGAFAYAVSTGLKAFVGAETTEDLFQWPIGGSNSRVETATVSGIAGLATNEDGGDEFRQSHFSDVQLQTKLSYSPYSYDSVIDEAKSAAHPDFYPETNFQADGGVTLEIGAEGWLRNSGFGMRVSGAGAGFGYLGVTYSFFQFEGELAIHLFHLGGFTVNEFIGARVWTVPVIYNSATSSNFRSEDPTLLGAVDTLSIEQKMGRFRFSVTGEVSSPLGALDKNSYVTQILPQAMSYRGEAALSYELTKDLAAAISGGYKLDQYRYIAGNRNQDRSSTATISCDLLSVSGLYNF